MENSFDLFSCGLNTEKPVSIPTGHTNNDISLVCEAIQIIKMVKTVMQTRREIIDTIKIDGAKMTYERALRVANSKAKAIGNCMVVEKLERVVSAY